MLTMQDLASGQILDLIKDGCSYNIHFYDKESNTLINKKFKTIDDAQGEYIKIVNYFIHGVYTFEQRSEDLRR